jgi:cytoskeleton protein RodZ
MHVGLQLRNARTEKGLSLEQMSSVLKVKVPVLQALEEIDTMALPPLCYVRGYLDTYARELGLDPGEIIAEYIPEMTAMAAEQRAARVQAEAAAAEAKLQRRYALREQALIAAERERQAAHAARLAAQAALAAKSRIAFLSAREQLEYWTRWTRHKPVMAAAAVLVVALLFVALVPATNRAQGATPAAASIPAATPPSPGASETAAAAASVKRFRIELVTTRPVVVSATADGQSVLSRQLNAGERQVIEIADRFVLRVSDPTAITWSVDGRPGRTLGKPGQSVTVQMTRDTINQYVTTN